MRRLLLVAVIIAMFFSGSSAKAQLADAPRDAKEVERTVQDVLKDPDYRHLFYEEGPGRETRPLPDWYKQIIKDFFEWLFGDWSSGDSSSSDINAINLGEWLLYSAIVILIAIILIILINIFRKMEGSPFREKFPELADQEAITPSTPPGDIPTNEYEQRALAAAANGDYRTALRELVLGSMSWTERAGRIRYRRGLTNRDYVRANWQDVERKESLLLIVMEFEKVFYGKRLAEESSYTDCLSAFRESFLVEGADAHRES